MISRQQVTAGDGLFALAPGQPNGSFSSTLGRSNPFADFDAFLAELVLDRTARLDGQAAALRDSAGTGSVAANLTGALIALFAPVAVAILGLVISRDGLRARLRQAGAARIPLIAEGTAMIASYLTAERDIGRVRADADVDVLAHTLIGAVHLLFTDRDSTAPPAGDLHKIVTTVIPAVVPTTAGVTGPASSPAQRTVAPPGGRVSGREVQPLEVARVKLPSVGRPRKQNPSSPHACSARAGFAPTGSATENKR